MRRFLLALFAAIGMAMTSLAQYVYTPDLAIGVKGGCTFSKMEFSPAMKLNMAVGYTGGLSVRYTEEKLFGLLGEVNITQRGWGEDFRGADFRYARHLTYVQVPLLTQIRFGWPKFKILVNLGPEVGYMIGSNIDADFDYQNPGLVEGFPANRRTEQLYHPIEERFDYGIAGGLGLEFLPHRRHSFILEGRYYFGIANIFKAGRQTTFKASRGWSIELTLAYMFRVI